MIWRNVVAGRAYGTFSNHRRRHNSKKNAQRNMQNDALQELETPTIVRLAQHQPLLHDAQHRRVLVCLDHRRGVARKEGTQQCDESWDGTLLSPHGRREQEREEGAVVDGHALVQGQHLGEDLKDIGCVFCDSQQSTVA